MEISTQAQSFLEKYDDRRNEFIRSSVTDLPSGKIFARNNHGVFQPIDLATATEEFVRLTKTDQRTVVSAIWLRKPAKSMTPRDSYWVDGALYRAIELPYQEKLDYLLEFMTPETLLSEKSFGTLERLVKFLNNKDVSGEEKQVTVLFIQSKVLCMVQQAKEKMSNENFQKYRAKVKTILRLAYGMTSDPHLKRSSYFDTDLDGVVDIEDHFAFDRRYTKDSDHDGVADEIDPKKLDPNIWHNLKEGEVRVFASPTSTEMTENLPLAHYFVTVQNGNPVIVTELHFTNNAENLDDKNFRERISEWEVSTNAYLNTHQEAGKFDILFDLRFSTGEKPRSYYRDVSVVGKAFDSKIPPTVEYVRSESLKWYVGLDPRTSAHEAAHLLGVVDRYYEAGGPGPDPFLPGLYYYYADDPTRPGDLMGDGSQGMIIDTIHAFDETKMKKSDSRRLVAEAVPIEIADAADMPLDLLLNLDKETITRLLNSREKVAYPDLTQLLEQLLRNKK